MLTQQTVIEANAKKEFDGAIEGILSNFREAIQKMLNAVLETQGILNALLPAEFGYNHPISEVVSIAYKSNVVDIPPRDPLEGVKRGIVYLHKGVTYTWGNQIPRTLAEIGKMGTVSSDKLTEGYDHHRVVHYCDLTQLAVVAEHLSALVKGIWSSLGEFPDHKSAISSCLAALEDLKGPSGVRRPKVVPHEVGREVIL